MLLASLAVILGLALLVWSADRFVEGAAATARHLGMSPLMVGMVVVGFGTSAPELMVGALAAGQGNPGLALGNAYGSNISNIALILGLTAILCPIPVQSRMLRKELPILTAVTALAAWQAGSGDISRIDAIVLLVVFAVVMAWTIWQGARQGTDTLVQQMEQELGIRTLPIRRAVFWLAAGLVLLLVSSHVLVWGAVELARGFGVSDLIVGLTVVAIGTSLPELASSMAAARRNEPDIALGNVLGSNLFNTLATVGIAGTIRPMTVDPEIFSRDIPVMGLLTISLFVIGSGFRGRPGRINRLKGAGLLMCFVGYTAYLVISAF